MNKQTLTAVTLGICIALLVPAADAERRKRDHSRRIKGSYEGTQTCLECHEDEAKAFLGSSHYQWSGGTPHIVNTDGRTLGKLSLVNDFCTNPSGDQWIGEVKNKEGKVLARGCSTCHAGLGLLPTQEVNQEQLENIDCLICHASGYRRNLYPAEDGGWAIKPILWRNQEGLDSVSKRISNPKRVMCLRCHAASGGGPNYKRGDIEYTLSKPKRDFDVHMAVDGADMQCVDCHASDDMMHRVKGRGVDMAVSDSPNETLSCSGDCHNSKPHKLAALNAHTDKVYCTACHIKTFARNEPTDMFRDWSDLHYDKEKGKHTYAIDLQSNVRPVLSWFNGESYIQTAGTAVQRNEKGEVTMVIPQGSHDDPDAKLYAFKLHRSRMPVSKDNDWILPINTEEVYKHGNVKRAIRDASENFYGIKNVKYRWEDSIRYMGIFHGVQPATEALQCLDCHRPDGRINWTELGYDKDPIEAAFTELKIQD